MIPVSQLVSFSTQTNILFKGKASVMNWQISVSVLKFQRISITSMAMARLSLYAENGTKDANGFFTISLLAALVIMSVMIIGPGDKSHT